MIIGFWISLFILIISIVILVIYGITNFGYYNYSVLPYWIFGILAGISLFFVIFFMYYGKIS
jgi:hypothetical protein